MDFAKIFGGEALTLEQFAERTKGMKLVDLETGDYVDKKKFADADQKLKTANETIKTLQESQGDVATLQAELKKYQDAEEARTKAEQEAQAKAATLERFKAAKGDKVFSSDYAESGVLEAFSKALKDPANTGKGDAEIFAALTKDKEGVFKSANPAPNMGTVEAIHTVDADKMSDAEYYATVFGKKG